MKRLLAIALFSAMPFAFANAQAPDKEHPPQKAMEKETPEMKNPEGTEKLHPPQKAMDEATPTEKKGEASASKSASSTSAAAAQFPAWDTRKAGEGMTLKSK